MKYLLLFLSLLSVSYKQKIKEYEKELRRLHRELVSIEKKKRSVIKRLEIIDRQLELLEDMLQTQRSEEDSLRKSVGILKREIDSLETDLTYKRAVLKTYLIRLYKYGNPNFLEIMLNAGNPYESYRMMKIYNRVLTREKKLYEQVESDIKELNRKRELLKQRLREITKLENNISYRRSQLIRKRIEKRALLRRIKNKEKLKKYRLRQIELAKRRLEKLLSNIEKKRVKKKKKYVAKSKGFMWPVRGKVISKFGIVVHPKYGTRVNNIGIDIKTSPGAEVVASRDGVVVFSGPFISYKGVVILEHGSTYTVYANLNKILVKNGMVVDQGEVIGELSITDPVLHFEIRIRGKAVDPLKYLR